MLTDVACRSAACPPDKARARFTDAGGLYLEVAPTGSKRWFWKYYFDGKEKRLALGAYPDVRAKEARSSRDDARKLLSTGADPAQQRLLERATKRASAVTTFEAVAREFHTLKKKDWSEAQSQTWLARENSIWKRGPQSPVHTSN